MAHGSGTMDTQNNAIDVDMPKGESDNTLVGTSLRSSSAELPNELSIASPSLGLQPSTTASFEGMGGLGSLAANASATLGSINPSMGHYSNLMVSDANMLDTSLRYIPETTDSERYIFLLVLVLFSFLLVNSLGLTQITVLLSRARQYTARNAYVTPSYYPQQPLSAFENAALFEKFDTDTLFFIFYYQQGTYQQYVAQNHPLFSVFAYI